MEDPLSLQRQLWLVERDICFLYHQLSSYSSIIGDLDYDLYGLPYWDFLGTQAMPEEDSRFIREGCLVMILAMALDRIDGSGAYIDAFVRQCLRAVQLVEADDEDTERLVRTVEIALDLASERKPTTPQLKELCRWVHERYVRQYFSSIAASFGTDPYFAGAA